MLNVPSSSTREIATHDEVSTLELAKRIRAGDSAAFETLYKMFWNAMYNFAFRYVQSGEEAEDLVQEVFFRIWRTRSEWNVIGSVQNYLFISIRNASIVRLRRNATAQRWTDRERSESSCSLTVDAETELELAEKRADIERALAEMPEKRRIVCAMRWIDGMSYAEIAERVGISEKTVENHIGNGVKFMREHIRRR
jgi:RNA polymerase sigma-70 factor (ECF subfamily)